MRSIPVYSDCAEHFSAVIDQMRLNIGRIGRPTLKTERCRVIRKEKDLAKWS